MYTHTLYIYIYVYYIYTHIEREREGGGERDRYIGGIEVAYHISGFSTFRLEKALGPNGAPVSAPVTPLYINGRLTGASATV
jgi:hypothetical protein